MISMILVFLVILGLKLTINRKKIVELSLVFVFIPILPIGIVFIFLNQWLIAFWVPKVNFSSLERWL